MIEGEGLGVDDAWAQPPAVLERTYHRPGDGRTYRREQWFEWPGIRQDPQATLIQENLKSWPTWCYVTGRVLYRTAWLLGLIGSIAIDLVVLAARIVAGLLGAAGIVAGAVGGVTRGVVRDVTE